MLERIKTPQLSREMYRQRSPVRCCPILKDTHPVTESALGANPEATVGSLIIRGNFTTIKQGNKTARMMIGLGRGASDVQAHVLMTLITADGPILLREFNIDTTSGKKPGAVETLGVGSLAAGAAAGAATDGKSTVKGDTSRLANAVAKQLKQIITAQGWISNQASKQVAPEPKPSQ